MNVHLSFLLASSYILVIVADATEEERIVGGHEAKPYSHPYIVSLQIRFLWVRAHVCGGALLNEYWILSAAHCLKESWLIRWLPMDAVLGIHDVDNYGSKAQLVGVGLRIPHPRYKGGVGPHDIAVLKLNSPVTFTPEVQPIKLPTGFNTNRKLELAGWGVLSTTFFIPDLPEKLQEVELTFLSFDECYEAVEDLKESYEENPLDKEINICTGPITGGTAACSGDSGGPLIQFFSKPIQEATIVFNVTNLTSHENLNVNDQNENNQTTNYEDRSKSKKDDLTPVIVGVVSWGISPCGQKGAPTVYTKVSNYLDFINDNIKT